MVLHTYNLQWSKKGNVGWGGLRHFPLSTSGVQIVFGKISYMENYDSYLFLTELAQHPLFQIKLLHGVHSLFLSRKKEEEGKILGKLRLKKLYPFMYSRDHKESDTTEQLNWTELMHSYILFVILALSDRRGVWNKEDSKNKIQKLELVKDLCFCVAIWPCYVYKSLIFFHPQSFSDIT